MGESREHHELKRAAVQWAREKGYRALGTEVRVPNSPFRADVAGCRMERPEPGRFEIASTAVFECKQARSDFLSDSFRENGGAERLRLLHRRREKLERLVGSHYPQIRSGDSLFPEFDRCDPCAIGHRGYRRISAEIAALQRGLHRRTKFDRMVRYRCVDLCYLVIRRGLIEEREVPDGWGVVECEFEGGTVTVVELARPARWLGATAGHRLELLHWLAVRGAGEWS